MPIIKYVSEDGAVRSVDGAVGSSVMENAVRNSVPGIVAECGGNCACATCHVYVDEAFYDLVGPPSLQEGEMLEFVAAERRPTSRLSCQVKLRDEYEGLTVAIPSSQ